MTLIRKESVHHMTARHDTRVKTISATLLALLCALACWPASAGAYELPEDVSNPDEFHISINLGMWATRMDGSMGVKDVSATIDEDFWDVLDFLKFGIFPGVEVRKSNWVFSVNGMYARLEDDFSVQGPFVKRGGTVTLDQAYIDATVGYTIVDSKTTGGHPVPIQITPLAGIRWTYLKVEVDPDNFSSRDDSKYWVDPIIGGMINVGLAEKVKWRTIGTIGGFGVGSKLTWSAASFIDIQLFKNGWLNVGYQAVAWDYEASGGFDLDLTLSGPWIGFTWQIK